MMAGDPDPPLDPDVAARLARQYGTPLFLYDCTAMRAAAARLQRMLPPGALVFYAVKANPAPRVIRFLAGLGLGAEVASGGELALVLGCGVAPDRIVFSGPAKTPAELESAVAAGLYAIQVESWHELQLLQSICSRAGSGARVALRVNLGRAAAGGGRGTWGGIQPFGMDHDELRHVIVSAGALDRIRVVGVHSHQGSQAFDAAELLPRYAALLQSAVQLSQTFALEYVNFGGGFGAPFYADDLPLELAPLQVFFAQATAPGGPLHACRAVPAIEPGRYLMGPAGQYLACVIGVKRSFGTRFALLDGGTNHVLVLSGAFRTMRRPVSADRLGTPRDVPREPTEVCGPLCTPIDRLASQLELPCDLAAGDLLVFHNCGAYAKHASPLTFLGHDWPAEVLVDGTRAELAVPQTSCAERLGWPGTKGEAAG